MRKLDFLLIFLFVLSLMQSCDSDLEMDYDINDLKNYNASNTSLTGQFEAVWSALSLNYPIWDYEAEFGTDWDMVHKKYLPVFQELDRKYGMDNPVPDSVLWDYYNKVMNYLHDGHINLRIKNIHKGNEVCYSYSYYRIPNILSSQYQFDKSYGDHILKYYFKRSLSLRYYNENSETNKLSEYKCANGNRYSNTDQFAVFDDNIIYYYLKDYHQTSDSLRMDLWRKWFEKVQKLKKESRLKGLVIDLRGNTGGVGDNNKYVIGSLVPSVYGLRNEIQIGYLREKKGIGRFEYAEPYPVYMPVLEEDHVTITEQIVILTDSLTSSTAELACLFAKERDNMTIIGTRTWGCYSPLWTGHVNHYAGFGKIGDESLKETSFYISMPYATFLTKDKKIIESIGVKPDVEIVLDRNLFNETGRDNQLERALKFIRTGK